MRYTTTGASNSAFGYGSLFDNIGGDFNSAFGYGALGGNTTGTYNIGLGAYAGDTLPDGVTYNTTSDNSIFIGYATHPSQSNGQNEIVIGDQAIGNGSNSVTLGNTSITRTILRGDVSASSYQGSGANLTGVVTQIVAGTNITISPASGTGSVTINASGGSGGGGAAAGSVARQTFAAATTWSFNHGLGQQYPVFTVYDANSRVMIPADIVATNANTASILFSSATSGSVSAVAASGFPFTGSAIISGSLQLTGSFGVIGGVSASNGFTGSLLGTSSFAISSSRAISASWAPSSFPFTGSAIVSGSFIITGSLQVSGSTHGIAEHMIIALTDESSSLLTTGNSKVVFRAPFAMYLPQIPRASVSQSSSSGVVTVDINEAGTSILSTKLTIDATEKTSVTAATAAVLSDRNIADDAEITLDVDTAGTGVRGLKVTLYYVKV
jgi:hypothetical protein